MFNRKYRHQRRGVTSNGGMRALISSENNRIYRKRTEKRRWHRNVIWLEPVPQAGVATSTRHSSASISRRGCVAGVWREEEEEGEKYAIAAAAGRIAGERNEKRGGGGIFRAPCWRGG